MTDELLSKERLKNQTQPQIRDRLRLSRFFQKLLITRDSAAVLTKMALFPHLRSIFLYFVFEPVYLPEVKGLAPSDDVDFWMRRFQAMSISGSDLQTVNKLKLGEGLVGLMTLKRLVDHKTAEKLDLRTVKRLVNLKTAKRLDLKTVKRLMDLKTVERLVDLKSI